MGLYSLMHIRGLQACDKAVTLRVKTTEFFSRINYMKVEFSFQRKEMLLFLTTNMAAVTHKPAILCIHYLKLLSLTQIVEACMIA